MVLNHGRRIRQRQILYRLASNLDALTFIPSIRWLRFVRLAGIAFCAWAYALGMNMDALLALVGLVIVQIILFQVSVIEVLKDKSE